MDRSDERLLRLQPDLVVRRVRDRASGEQRREPRAARRQDATSDAVAVEERAASAGMKPQDVVERRSGQIAVRPGAAEGVEEVVFLPFAGHAGRDRLLGEDVERGGSRGQEVELPASDAVQQRGALDELVERQRKEPTLRDAREGVAGAADPLQERRDRPRGADLDDEVHVADVDSELERGRGHQRPEPARLEALLGVEAALPREAAVVARHSIRAEALRELSGQPLGHLARVDEDERRPVLPHERVDACVDLVPLLVRADGREGRGRDLDGEVELAEAARVDDPAVPADAREKAPDVLERLLRGRQADALERALRQRLQPLDREREVAAALVAIEGVDLVHDDRPDRREHRSPAVARQKEVQRLGRRDQDVRRPPGHRRPLARGRVAGAHEDADLRQPVGEAADLPEGRLEVLLHVVREGAQGRDVEDFGGIGEIAAPAHELAQGPEERGQGLAAARRRRDQGVAARGDGRPAGTLALRRFAETVGEPALDGGMEGGKGAHRVTASILSKERSRTTMVTGAEHFRRPAEPDGGPSCV